MLPAVEGGDFHEVKRGVSFILEHLHLLTPACLTHTTLTVSHHTLTPSHPHTLTPSHYPHGQPSHPHTLSPPPQLVSCVQQSQLAPRMLKGVMLRYSSCQDPQLFHLVLLLRVEAVNCRLLEPLNNVTFGTSYSVHYREVPSLRRL